MDSLSDDDWSAQFLSYSTWRTVSEQKFTFTPDNDIITGMRKNLLVLLFLFLGVLNADVAMAAPSPDECLVIGGGSDPVKGTNLFAQAVRSWRLGAATQALQYYEQAIIADRGILSRDDEGMAFALLEQYRKMSESASPTVALLCRKGFFENIIIGDLEESIRHYRQAAEVATNDREKATAAAEADRLSRELAYIQQWRADKEKKLERERRTDLVEYTRREANKQVADRRDDLDAELEQLTERLAYLKQQEAQSRDEMYENMRKATRYRRWTYYEGPQGLPEGEVRDPAQDLELMYASRRRMNSAREQTEQIRSEIIGIEKRIETLKKERQKLENR